MNSLEISQRGQKLPQSAIRRLTPYAEQARKDGKTIYQMNIGQPDIKSPVKAIHKLKEYDLDLIPYGKSAGNDSLRQKIVNSYKEDGLNVEFDDVFITTGGSEAINFIFISCLNEGDEIIIPEPFYTNYNSYAIQSGVNIVTVESHIENDFALPPISEIEAKITSKTKAIFICNPNNPSGYVYTKEELVQIKELVKKHNLYLISDEVYNHFCFDGVKHHSILEFDDIQEHSIVITSVSKLFSFCGVRIGAIVSKNKTLLKTVLKLGQARLCPPILGQYVAEYAYVDSADYIEEVRQEYLKRRDYLVNELNKIEGVYAPMPKGAFYTTVKLPVKNSEDFCQWLLEKFSHENQTVMLSPGSGFYNGEGKGLNEVRVAFVIGIEKIKKAVECIKLALEQYVD
jgi:aspartate aminotransferase